MVRGQEAGAFRDDTVAVMVGVAGETDVEAIPQGDEPLHGVRRRRIHADLPVPIDAHEAEGGIDLAADDRQVEPIALGDRAPVVYAGAAERVDTEVQAAAADRLEVDHVGKVADVGVEKIVAMRGGCPQRLLERRAPDALQPTLEHGIGLRLDPARDGAVGGTARGRIVLEATAVRRVVRGGDDDAIGEAGGAAAVVGEDGVRHAGGRRVGVVAGDHHLDAVGGQDLERTGEGGDRQGVRVHAEKERSVDRVRRAIQTDRLGHRQDVPLVEALFERRAAMSRGAEGDPLRRHRRIGPLGIVGRDQPRHVDQQRRFGGLPCERAHVHAIPRRFLLVG